MSNSSINFQNISLPNAITYEAYRSKELELTSKLSNGETLNLHGFGISVDTHHDTINDFKPLQISEEFQQLEHYVLADYPNGGFITLDLSYYEMFNDLSAEDDDSVFILTSPFKKKSTTDDGENVWKFELVKLGDSDTRILGYCGDINTSKEIRIGSMQSAAPVPISPVPDEIILKHLRPNVFVSHFV